MLLQFSDAARLLNFYQLWLDDLFPRAKFADGLAMIERLGHSKRIQTMRREWIEEEKPKSVGHREPLQDAPDTRDLSLWRSSGQQPEMTAEAGHPSRSQSLHDARGNIDSDLFMPDAQGETRPATGYPESDDDDLEYLLREQDENVAGQISEPMPRTTRSGHDDFDAEYEAMNDLGI